MARAFGGALLLLGAGGVVIAAVEIALFWPLEGPVWLYSLFSLAGLVYLAAGLAAWWRRPSNNIGAIIVLSGAVWLAAALVNTDVTALVAVGLILATGPLASLSGSFTRSRRGGCAPNCPSPPLSPPSWSRLDCRRRSTCSRR